MTICADPDLDIEKCVDVLKGDGSTQVHVIRFDRLDAENVKDANDYLREAGETKLREALATAKLFEEAKQIQLESERQWPTEFEVIDPSLRYAWRKVEDGWQICLWFVSKSK